VRAVVQRVKNARVSVDGVEKGRIESGLLAYVGIRVDDSAEDAGYLADKIAKLRVFEDSEGKMNLSVNDVSGGVLAVSQFTLYADARKGRRPSYSEAASNEAALPIYEGFLAELRSRVESVSSGVFRSRMDVSYTNSGPVTILLDSRKVF
jgi:D-tyrosyl-tRNA(Tyr) deacylase